MNHLILPFDRQIHPIFFILTTVSASINLITSFIHSVTHLLSSVEIMLTASPVCMKSC